MTAESRRAGVSAERVAAVTSVVLDALHGAHHKPGSITMLELAEHVAAAVAATLDDGLRERVEALALDVLPDGRVDHRTHEREDQGGIGWGCVPCSTEDYDVEWTVPYDIDGRPMPDNWRNLPYVRVAALCGLLAAQPTADRSDR